jgi:hypothetical protein
MNIKYFVVFCLSLFASVPFIYGMQDANAVYTAVDGMPTKAGKDAMTKIANKIAVIEDIIGTPSQPKTPPQDEIIGAVNDEGF